MIHLVGQKLWRRKKITEDGEWGNEKLYRIEKKVRVRLERKQRE